jgi:hypothetical protein
MGNILRDLMLLAMVSTEVDEKISFIHSIFLLNLCNALRLATSNESVINNKWVPSRNEERTKNWSFKTGSTLSRLIGIVIFLLFVLFDVL